MVIDRDPSRRVQSVPPSPIPGSLDQHQVLKAGQARPGLDGNGALRVPAHHTPMLRQPASVFSSTCASIRFSPQPQGAGRCHPRPG